MKNDVHVAFIGNPNCGKTTLFNAYTGAHLKVANWPGVTVEKKEGALKYHNNQYKLVDLPGIYSLTSYTMEERLSRQYILEDEVDIIVDVVDASSLERNLYLALQLIELGKPLIIALNMMDVIEERGMDIDLHRLPEMLGVPVIPVCARRKKGLQILLHAVAHHKNHPRKDSIEHQHEIKEQKSRHRHNHHKDTVVVYSDWLEDKIDAIENALWEKYGSIENPRWHALKLLAYDEEIMNKYPLEIPEIIDKSYEKEIIKQKYDFIEEIIEEVLFNKDKESQSTDKIDTVLTHRYLGMPVFLAIMAFIFFLTFTIGDFFQEWIVQGIDITAGVLQNLLTSINVSPVINSLLIDGIIAGVGSILAFLPNIFILFLALAVLEDSGYMSRVAYVMDGLMGKVGLSGRAFIPLLLGFGCSVPAIMASRALENPRDRLKTILITPFMSCSARLPIYILFSGMFFGDMAMYVAFSLYVVGIIVAIALALLFSRIDKSKSSNTLLIELPEYKTPNVLSIFIYAWEKVKSYLSKAGTTIFVASLLMWFILHFNMNGMVTNISDSFGAYIGKAAAPLLSLAGLDVWQLVVALLSGIAAKEVVVSSVSILYGVSDINSVMGTSSVVKQLANVGFTQLNAYVLMVFCLLYTPCIASIVTIKKETGKIRWAVFSVFFQLFVAWFIAVILYQFGRLLLR
ncbi:ferrous iron transport protein B [Pectinatus brassicae]|uniref:Ferrous iron transport protein B n=1 Tax=Pectinatus brassicae TaxID=862415 RepID=A0A840UUS3_9FIRM|nr:ferrous iron transport protein B [Pectinatus brassicae]MBB5336205.1 ferrous iron transport protein B [Pectinatus brassicae]